MEKANQCWRQKNQPPAYEVLPQKEQLEVPVLVAQQPAQAPAQGSVALPLARPGLMFSLGPTGNVGPVLTRDV
eukprot:4392163-Amphidinium_carterae.1